jgi:hypothetical protein
VSAASIAVLNGGLNGLSILQTGGGSVTLNSNVDVHGTVGDNGSNFTLNNNVTVDGNVYLNQNTSKTINNNKFDADKIKQNADSDSTLAQAVSEANAAYSRFTGLPNNNYYSDISEIPLATDPNHPKKNVPTIQGTYTPSGYYVVDITNLLLNTNTNLYLSGTSDMSFVVRISGTFTLNSNNTIGVEGGLKADNVTFVATGSNGVILNSNTDLQGSILSKNSSITLNSNSHVKGALVSGKDIMLNSNVDTPPKTFMSKQAAYLVQ